MAPRSPVAPTLRRWFLSLALLASLAAHLDRAQPAHAQDAATDEPELPVASSDEASEAPASANPVVRAILVEAVAEYDAGHYAEAQALFRRAHELAPSARTLRGLGMASFEMRHYVDALHALEQALIATERPLTDSQRAHVSELLARARGFVGTLRLEIEPADASIRIDGAPPTPEPDGALLLDPGTHVIAIDHPDYRSRSFDVHVDSGVSQVRTIELAAPEAAPPPPPAPRDDGLWWATAGFGIAAAVALVASAITGIIALSDRDQLRASCAVYVCSESLRATRDRANELSVTTDVLGTGAAILGATSIVFAIVAATAPSGERATVAAGCTGDGCSASIGGSF